MAHGDREHLRGRRHLEIERYLDLAAEACDVVVGDVAAVLAQMRGDAVRAGRDRQPRGPHRIGMPPAAGIADGGDVIDVHAQTQRPQQCHRRARSTELMTGVALSAAMIVVRWRTS